MLITMPNIALIPDKKALLRFNRSKNENAGRYVYAASRWLSADPAMGEYIPSAPISGEARRRNGNLPGMGGVFNYVNLHAYHYAGNNPVRYVDPDGRELNIPSLDIAGYFDNLIQRGLSLPGIAFVNLINSGKNFISNAGKGEGSLSAQVGVRLAGSQLNFSFYLVGREGSFNPSLIESFEAITGTPIRTKFDKNNNLTGLEFHVGVADIESIAKISTIIGGNFDTETGDVTTIIGAKLSALGIIGLSAPETSLENGGPSKTSITVKLLLKASTIGDNPTIQGRDFANNFSDRFSRDRFNEVWKNHL
jgi:hypothetical protein